jgi:hypothetical protein
VRKRIALVVAVILLIAQPVQSQVTNNDDSCDIGLAPAATLLLPYFEVETATHSVDTFFSITNVSPRQQIAHVTIWTDWAYPVLTFDLILSGYAVQSISLYDVVVGGVVRSGIPNSIFTPLSCNARPLDLSSAARAAVASALVSGVYDASDLLNACGTKQVGSGPASHRTKTTAVGYVTVDVTSRCSTTMPSDPSYVANEILFDNVLIGDYETIDKTSGNNFATGNPMVHIRAVPEGGPAGTALSGPQTNLRRTFYSRFINDQVVGGRQYSGSLAKFDRRQPLPATFAARWIQAAPTAFETTFKIWREGATGPASCENASSNSTIKVQEIVRFDDHENPMTFAPSQIICTTPPYPIIVLPPASSTPTASDAYPRLNSLAGDVAGWMYLNLDRYPDTFPPEGVPPLQNWVIVSISGRGSSAGRFAVEFDATWLGNGCSAAAQTSSANGGPQPIGPAGGVLVCPPNHAACTSGAGLFTGTNITP